ncbi:prolyl endopeptidase-like [Planoprotostelium fungivorum]|uniref:Alkylated DNA repair protein alkB homolog 8 n=1 Tax=Planoprotostelium fungivorum TaxID=1890364 RepID=A0A2P6N7I8_9EUKA|nr:prolyl endopeptidase-like [Planoprotostelium fungivorum]
MSSSIDIDGRAVGLDDFHRPGKKERMKGSPYLYVTNVMGVHPESVQKVFQPFGDIVGILRSEEQKGILIVAFSNVQSARTALESLRGKSLDVVFEDTGATIQRIMHTEFSILKEKLSQEEMKEKQHREKGMVHGWPKGLWLFRDFITREEESNLVQQLEASRWSNKIGRRVQHYGYEFNYSTKHVDTAETNPTPPIPSFLQPFVDRLSRLGDDPSNEQENSTNNTVNFSESYRSEGNHWMTQIDQITVNEYRQGQGIAPHIDTHSAFEDGMCSLSLLSQSIMEFKHPEGTRISVYLPRRSLVVLTAESRYLWTHSIPSRKTDLVEPVDLQSDSDLREKFTENIAKKTAAVVERCKRISLTFRRCDTQNSAIKLPDRIGKLAENTTVDAEEDSLAPTPLEKDFVHKFYNTIASHFSQTRHSPWPQVEDFIKHQPLNTFGIDVGCGNGRHMILNPNIQMVGCDVSTGLVDFAKSKGLEVLVGDALVLPHRSNFFDFVTCIAVIHHFSTEFHRMRILKELMRIVRVGGKVMVSAWALEQGSESKRRFENQDVMVPWKKGEEEVQRFCHVFREGELEEMISGSWVDIVNGIWNVANIRRCKGEGMEATTPSTDRHLVRPLQRTPLRSSIQGLNCRWRQPSHALLRHYSNNQKNMPFRYPDTRRDESAVDDYHGTSVKDPYRWLEDPDSEETTKWVKAQNEVTNGVLNGIEERSKFLERLKEVRNYVDQGAPRREGKFYYWWKNQPVLYQCQDENLHSEDVVVVIDPNSMNAAGTTAVQSTSYSKSGKRIAYSVAESGSDWNTIRFIDVSQEFKKDGSHIQHQSDVLEYVKFSSLQWTPDEKGVLYCKYAKPKSIENEGGKLGKEVDANRDQKVYLHVVGTPQSEDRLVYEDTENPEWMFSASNTEDEKYLYITVSRNCEKSNSFYYLPWSKVNEEKGAISPIKMISDFRAQYDYIDNDGPLFYFTCNLNAPKNKLIVIDINRPDEEKDIIPESKSDVLQWVTPVNENLFLVSWLRDVKEILELYDREGKKVKEFPLPIGQVIACNSKKEDRQFHIKHSSFLSPGTIFSYNFDRAGDFKEIYQTEVKGLDTSKMLTEQIKYESKDGTTVPMFVIRNKDIIMDGSHGVLLYGYGGFSISLSPSFSAARLLFIQHYGAIVAIANLRGGNEYGEDWHLAGTLERKQNVFDDFISAGHSLVRLGYTSPRKIAIQGGSNGGLLVAACANQEPELFGAAVAQVGVLDMLKFHKFTIGYAWVSDYGSSDDAAGFQYLYKYSPLHNVKKGREYPSMLLMTADHDDRVVPLHSFKHISELQYQLGGEEYQKRPLLIRIEENAGHGAGKPMIKILQEAADMYTFISDQLGLKWRN